VEGIKPRLDEGETEVAFEIKDGIFRNSASKPADPKTSMPFCMRNRGNVILF
jgi:hypothetical protein